jgi:putative transposase
MPRMMRFEYPGNLVHVMVRGLEGKSIFQDDYDRQEFLVRFTRVLHECGYRCLAWCLMPNHYHLFIRTNEHPMSTLMRPLNGGYARWFNHKYRRRGYLFQDRFKSILCQDQEYARQLIRYIHLNPLRAGEVDSLEALMKWPWCGHGHLLKIKGAAGQSFQDRNEALRRFGVVPGDAMQSYIRYIREGIDKECIENAGQLPDDASFEIAGSHKGWPAVIGDAEFAMAAMIRHEVAVRRRHRQADYLAILEKIAREVTSSGGVDYNQLFEKGRQNKRSHTRERFCYIAYFEEKIPFAVIARFLKGTIPPVVLLARRGKNRSSRIDTSSYSNKISPSPIS